MKVLLISPSWGNLFGSYRNVARLAVLYPPLGLCYLSASLRRKGHDVDIIDMEAESLSVKETLKRALQYYPDILGITSVSPLIGRAETVAQNLKKTLNKPIILGGPHLTIVGEEALRNCQAFDYGVVGEGEKTFCELLDALEGNGSLEDVKGILFRKSPGNFFYRTKRTRRRYQYYTFSGSK